MENLSALNTKCLSNMPMLLDSISQTIAKLEKILSPYYDSLLNDINSAGYSILAEWNRGTIWGLGHHEKHKTQYLGVNSIYPEISLYYKLPFEKKRRRNPVKFRIDFGYMSAAQDLNVIYFQLFEISEKQKILVDDFWDEIEQSIPIPDEWEKGIEDINDNNIYVQFTMDESLSTDKIDDLFNVFKKYILLPTIDKLK